MKTLTNAEKADIQALTDAYAASVKTHPTKGKHDFKGSETESNFANFSADIADFGSFDGIYDGNDIAEYNAKAKEVAAMSQIRKLTLAHSIQANLKEWILKKNNISKRNRAAKLEAQKAFGNR